MIVDRGSNADWGVEGTTSLLLAGPYRWGRTTSGPTASRPTDSHSAPIVPPRCADRRLRRRVAPRRARGRARPRPARAPPAERGRRRGRRHRRNAFPVIAAVEVAERREHPLWSKRGSLPEDEGIGLAASYWPGASEPAAAVLSGGQRGDDDGRHVRGRHERRGHRVRRDRRSRVRAPARARARRLRRHGDGPTRVPAEARRSRTPSARRCCVQRRRRARSCWQRRRSSRSLRDLEVVDGVVRAVGAPERLITVQDVAARHSASADATSRSRGTGAPRSGGEHLSWPRTRTRARRPRHRGGRAPAPRWSSRTSAGP